MNDKEKEFYEIFEDLRVLSRLTDAEIKDEEVAKHFRLMSNMIYFYRHHGVEKVKAAVRAKKLAALGIPVIGPKGKLS